MMRVVAVSEVISVAAAEAVTGCVERTGPVDWITVFAASATVAA